MNKTAIAWTDHTWNLFSGCKKISEECKFCYADTLAERHRGNPAFPHGFDLTVRPHKLAEPARLLKSVGPSLIFCESMSDVGLDDDELTVGEIARLNDAGFETLDDLRDAFFDAIVTSPEHRYQVLTKRPANLLRYFTSRDPAAVRKVLASCWIGSSIGHERSLSRLPDLLAFRELGSRVLFISAEPLLSDIVGAGLKLDGVDWLIAGGESGTHFTDARERFMSRFLVRHVTPGERAQLRGEGDWTQLRYRPHVHALDWARSIRDEAERAGCAFFFKQWGGPRPDSAGRILDGVEHDGMPVHVSGAMPERRTAIGAPTAALARKRLKMVQP